MIPKKKSVIDEKWIKEAYEEFGSYFPGAYSPHFDSNQFRIALANLGVLLTICPRCRTTAIRQTSGKKSEPEFMTAEWDPKRYSKEVKSEILPIRFKCTICEGVFEVREIGPKAKE